MIQSVESLPLHFKYTLVVHLGDVRARTRNEKITHLDGDRCIHYETAEIKIIVIERSTTVSVYYGAIMNSLYERAAIAFNNTTAESSSGLGLHPPTLFSVL
jgi:hypothetical protein